MYCGTIVDCCISWATRYHSSALFMCLAVCAAAIACCCKLAIQICAVNWQWQNDIAFHTGVLLPSLLFVCSCCFTMVLLFQLPLSPFFFHILCFVCTPPLFIVSCILFFSIAAFVILFVFISSNVNCCERLVKTEGACTHFVFCCSLEVLVPLCFLVVFII